MAEPHKDGTIFGLAADGSANLEQILKLYCIES